MASAHFFLSLHRSFHIVFSISKFFLPFFLFLFLAAQLCILKDILYISSNFLKSFALRIVFRILIIHIAKNKSCVNSGFEIF